MAADNHYHGSIPACAGEPLHAAARCPSTGVYPRVCGGTWKTLTSPLRLMGLSPRVRGNPQLDRAVRAGLGSIPACAGEPGVAFGVADVAGVYPRVCGGTVASIRRGAAVGGLSPRVRGNRAQHGWQLTWWRSIPACAGEPGCRLTKTIPKRVYPRVCGGTETANARRLVAAGLSPRVRGNPRRPFLLQHWQGSIPACAGEPSTTSSTTSRPGVYPRVRGNLGRVRAG